MNGGDTLSGSQVDAGGADGGDPSAYALDGLVSDQRDVTPQDARGDGSLAEALAVTGEAVNPATPPPENVAQAEAQLAEAEDLRAGRTPEDLQREAVEDGAGYDGTPTPRPFSEARIQS